jgi:hypothetical protein
VTHKYLQLVCTITIIQFSIQFSKVIHTQFIIFIILQNKKKKKKRGGGGGGKGKLKAKLKNHNVLSLTTTHRRKCFKKIIIIKILIGGRSDPLTIENPPTKKENPKVCPDMATKNTNSIERHDYQRNHIKAPN